MTDSATELSAGTGTTVTGTGTGTGGSVPPVTFTAPDGFHALPIAATERERAEKARAMVRELYKEGNEALWEQAARYYAAVGETVSDGVLAYSAFGIFTRDDGDGIAHCSFTVMAVPSGHESTEGAARGLEALLGSDPCNAVHWMDLPCGPAVACLSLRETTLPPEMTASGEPVALRTGQIQVHVPFPTGPFVAVLTLDTFALDQWQEWCGMAVAIMRTVEFGRDGQDGGALL